jgi:transcriptional regulator GlxA family with amidase domain
MNHPYRVGFLLYHDYLELDVVGPLTALRTARLLAVPAVVEGETTAETEPVLEFFTIARSRMSVVGASKLFVTPNFAFTATPPSIDALVIPGGPGVDRAGRDSVIRHFLVAQAEAGVRMVAVASGALVLASCGLLTGRTVTTWPPRREQLYQHGVSEVLDDEIVENSDGWLFCGHSHSGFELGLRLVQSCFDAEMSERVRGHLGWPH